ELFVRNGDNLTAEQRDWLEAIREDVHRLRDVAQDLLDLSRAQALSIALERREVELRDVVARVIKIFTPQASEKGVSVSAAMPAEGLIVTGDETKLTWAVSNLLANGLRYTPAGGRVDVQGAVHDGAVEITVSDTGPGIAPEQRERIFE